jgi:hypothetical protein
MQLSFVPHAAPGRLSLTFASLALVAFIVPAKVVGAGSGALLEHAWHTLPFEAVTFCSSPDSGSMFKTNELVFEHS